MMTLTLAPPLWRGFFCSLFEIYDYEALRIEARRGRLA
ncbi:hypothetical protein Z948_1405 [Sulfitobacter donghicola DSW-25 = KCTC 12864 = JCM 14565]|nr:hypothetical protein Z948_1405 [Sulfitobacter donghicola DSW-25 = KCTC 12864 = JCM 14565]